MRRVERYYERYYGFDAPQWMGAIKSGSIRALILDGKWLHRREIEGLSGLSTKHAKRSIALGIKAGLIRAQRLGPSSVVYRLHENAPQPMLDLRDALQTGRVGGFPYTLGRAMGLVTLDGRPVARPGKPRLYMWGEIACALIVAESAQMGNMGPVAQTHHETEHANGSTESWEFGARPPATADGALRPQRTDARGSARS